MGGVKCSVVIQIAFSSSDDKMAINDDAKKRKKNKKQTSRPKKQKQSDSRRDSDVEVRTLEEKLRDDDECCILDYDPTFQATEELQMDPRQQEEDISIIAQRGQVACRDYPHSRHLCVEHPFHKTPHESYCDQCYCYICEVVAPCKDWNGASGHCHASELDTKWKATKRGRREVPA